MGWLKKERSDAADQLAERLLRPLSLAAALAEVVALYSLGVRSGTIIYPAHRRPSPRLAQTWNDVRLEVFERMFRFGRCDLMLLAEIPRQRELLTAWADEAPERRGEQAVDEILEDTLRGIHRAYAYLQKVGSEVADTATDSYALMQRGARITDDFESELAGLRQRWSDYAAVAGGDMPKTILEILYDDVTAKTKSIALATIFGPNPEAGITYLLGEVATHGSAGDVANTKARIEAVRAAKEPDEIPRD